MADTKNTGLAELAAVPADDDLLYLVDVSDTSMAGTGTSKKNKAKYYLRTNGTANTLGANIAANGFNFTGAGTVGAGAILAANYYGGTASGGTATLSDYGFKSVTSLYAGGVTVLGEDGVRIVNSASTGYIDMKGSGDLVFRIDNNNGATERMRLSSVGDLTVTGKVKASSYQHTNDVLVANDGVVAMSTFTPITNGLVFVFVVSNGIGAIFQLRGGVNTTNEVSDIYAAYSATKDTGSSINVYYDGGYKIQNKLGGDATIAVLAFGS